MGTETALSVRDANAKAKEIDARFRVLVNEQAERNRHTSRSLAEMAALCSKMTALFRAKSPKDKILGFSRYDQWFLDRTWKLQGEKDARRRQGFYLASIGTYLLPRVGEKELVKMGIERAKALAVYAKAKNEIPEHLVAMATDGEVTAEKLTASIHQMIYRDGKAHREGKQKSLTVSGPHVWVERVREAIEFGRTQGGIGDGASPAEVIASMLQSYLQEPEPTEWDTLALTGPAEWVEDVEKALETATRRYGVRPNAELLALMLESFVEEKKIEEETWESPPPIEP
jgi:hypothetical protein